MHYKKNNQIQTKKKTKLQKADDQGIKVLKRLEPDHIGTTSHTDK